MNLPALLVKHKLAVLGGGAGGVVLLALLHRRSQRAASPAVQPTSSADPTAGYGYTTTPTYDSTAYDVYGAIEPQLEALQAEINAGSPVPVPKPTRRPPALPPAKSPPPQHRQPPPNPHYAPGMHRVGRLGQSISLRAIAAAALPAGASPDAVEAELRRIVARNPWLRGRTHVNGGAQIWIPR